MSAQELLDVLSRPHVCRGFLIEVEFPDGMRYFHNGSGTIKHDGKDWLGVNDIAGSQIVSVGAVRRPAFGEAPYIDIAVSAATPEIVRFWLEGRADFEGATCNIYRRVIDAETLEVLIPDQLLFPGKLTSGTLKKVGANMRQLTFKVVSQGEGLNFPSARSDWSPAGQRSRYPDDEGLDFIGGKLSEVWRP